MLHDFGAYSIIVGRVVTDSQERGKPLIHTWSISKKWWSGGDHLFLEGSHSKAGLSCSLPKSWTATLQLGYVELLHPEDSNQKSRECVYNTGVCSGNKNIMILACDSAIAIPTILYIRGKA